MKKEKIMEYLEMNLEEGKDYTYLVIDMRDWKPEKPELFEAWKEKDYA